MGRSGFTLVEIMVVVGMIAMLVLIAIPSWLGARTRTQARVCVSQLRDISGAKDAWALEMRRPESATPTFNDLCPGFLKTQPDCPESGSYTINRISIPPICSVGGLHVWPE